ncbi:uncharacterized protein UV8b_06179 [Ustilaginoidea virens]|uniref:Uncharacterized protein n=1 Tax=Ustilaginoidea virens TaxID=1159556 RepID=A0A8E5HV87_USTVR|nr:uncharacterized protein UV8b_06179 [Ustilaginoidea virens]QUC21938.1 hypothetical protein UV8b_06179 [Ustilaginoidea virens]
MHEEKQPPGEGIHSSIFYATHRHAISIIEGRASLNDIRHCRPPVDIGLKTLQSACTDHPMAQEPGINATPRRLGPRFSRNPPPRHLHSLEWAMIDLQSI